MKIQHRLLQIGGVLNALFFLFHLFLGWQIHHWKLDAGLRSLLEMLNGGGALFILFLAVASLAFTREVLATVLGRAVLVLGASLYLLRAVAEILIAPQPKPMIVATCLVTGAIYLVALVPSQRTPTLV